MGALSHTVWSCYGNDWPFDNYIFGNLPFNYESARSFYYGF